MKQSFVLFTMTMLLIILAVTAIQADQLLFQSIDRELDITKFNIDENQEFKVVVTFRNSKDEYTIGIDDLSGDKILITNGSSYSAFVENNTVFQDGNKYYVDTVRLTNGIMNDTTSPEISIVSLFTFADWEYWENNLTAQHETSISEGIPITYEIINLPQEFIHVVVHNSTDLYMYREYRYDKSLGLRTFVYIKLISGSVNAFSMERYENYQYFPLDVVKKGPPYPTVSSTSVLDTSKSENGSVPGLLLFNVIVTVILVRKASLNTLID